MATPDPRYVVSPDLQEYFVDAQTGLPLDFGLVFFYDDNNRTVLKPVYELQGNAIGGYTFAPLPNPMVLSGVGTAQDAMGNDIVVYYFPYEGTPQNSTGEVDLYYIVVTDKFGVVQFTRQAWPPESFILTPTPNSSQTISYVPNGQFLLHNNFSPVPYPNTASPQTFNYGIYTTDVTPVAPGGWTFEVSTTTTATYTITFPQYTSPPIGQPTTAPRYSIQIVRSGTLSNDTICDLRLKFMDVNEFASPTNFIYTFLFTAQSNAGTLPNINIISIRYYGSGSSTVTTEVLDFGPITFTSTPTVYACVVTFPLNAGSVGINDDDFVQIAIRFPAGATQTFNVQLTDFMLVQGTITQGEANAIVFPVTTNGEFMLQALSNIAPTQNPPGTSLSTTTNNYYQQDGSNLYLPMVMTTEGFTYDSSEIGTIIAKTSTAPVNNELLCDGSPYISSEYSPLGIPYTRLLNFALANSPVTNVPLWGTSGNYVLVYPFAGALGMFVIVNNAQGVGTYAVDGSTPTGFSFRPITPGLSTDGFVGYSSGASNEILVVPNVYFAIPIIPAADGAGGNATGFTITTNNNLTGYTTFQTYSFTIQTVAAIGLQNTGSSGKYFTFGNATTAYYMWFKFTNETDPAPGGIGIQILMPSHTLTAADVAIIVMRAISAMLVQAINVLLLPPAGSFFTFTTNPTSPMTFFVWYTINGVGTMPTTPGTGIKVPLLSTDGAGVILAKTQLAINSYQFALPDMRGKFLRGLDPTPIYDLDVALRFSSIPQVFGASVGTYEYQQLISHIHTVPTINLTSSLSVLPTSVTGTSNPPNGLVGTGASGGTETRPINMAVNFYIKY